MPKQANHNASDKRLKILQPAEIEALYRLPRFTQDEREEYFALTSAEKVVFTQLGSQKSQFYCMLQMGWVRPF